MISFRLEGRLEKLAPQDDSGTRWLYHQMRTREALQDHDVVINTYNTGTGKTRAALSRLIDLKEKPTNVLFIAPTNELIRQHARDTRKFIEEHRLNYKVIEATAKDIHALQQSMDVDLRTGEVLQRLISNYAEFEDYTKIRQPVVMVTNPDVFYYALYFQYGAHDQRNVFINFVSRFDYLVIDEFHYYNNKQVANFLFALTLFDELGYFSHRARKVCLLSATPRPNVLGYLYDVFGSRLAHITPDDEPPESADLETTPALAPLDVEVHVGALDEWAKTAAQQIRLWLDDGQEGAIISNSLARINIAYATLLPHIPESEMGRITGPETSQTRSESAQKPLILATPTVDIGYNFEKSAGRTRQNIDFLVAEAFFQDELIQRIGRAGRVLFKMQTDVPSKAVLLLSQDAAQALQVLDGRTLSREAFKTHLETDSLPTKHQLETYIRYYALQEATYPLFQYSKMLSPEDQAEVLMPLFDRLRRIFSPNSTWSYKSYVGAHSAYEKRVQWLTNAHRTNASSPPPEQTVKHLRDYFAWTSNVDKEIPDDARLSRVIGQMWKVQRDPLIAFVENQVALARAMFNFREAFQGVPITFYDAQRWFSSKSIATYDLLHVAAHYELDVLPNLTAFRRWVPAPERANEDIPKEGFYAVLRAPRKPPLDVSFWLDSPSSKNTFEEQWTCRPVALRGLKLRTVEHGSALPNYALPNNLIDALADQPIVCMIIPHAFEALARNRLRTSGYWQRNLEINFDDEAQRYGMYVGSAAFEAHAALEPLLRRQKTLEKRNLDPMIF